MRFRQLLKVCDGERAFSINDYGCGYGALAHFMAEDGYDFTYCGFDVYERMVALARERTGTPATGGSYPVRRTSSRRTTRWPRASSDCGSRSTTQRGQGTCSRRSRRSTASVSGASPQHADALLGSSPHATRPLLRRSRLLLRPLQAAVLPQRRPPPRLRHPSFSPSSSGSDVRTPQRRTDARGSPRRLAWRSQRRAAVCAAGASP